MGGSKKRKYDRANVVMICPDLHRAITESRLSDAVLDVGGERVYRVWDLHNQTIVEAALYWLQPDSETAEGGDTDRGSTSPIADNPAAVGVSARTNGASPVSPSGWDEEGRNAQISQNRHGEDALLDLPEGNDTDLVSGSGEKRGAVVGMSDVRRGDGHRPLSSHSGLAAPSGWDEWVQQLATLREARHANPHAEGWALLRGEQLFGEAATQAWDETGLSHQAIAQRIRVAKAFAPSEVDYRLAWAVYRRLSGAEYDGDDRWYYLGLCREGLWGEKELVARLRADGKLPPKEVVRSFSLPRLRELVSAYLAEVPNGDVDGFLEWLEVSE